MNRPGFPDRSSYRPSRRTALRLGAGGLLIGGFTLAFGGKIMDRIQGPKELKMSPAERALQHVRENVQWQEIIEFLRQNHFICIDGRCSSCAACTPGGDTGILFTQMESMQKVTGKKFTYEQVVDAIAKMHAHLHQGLIYEHTDDHAEDHFADAVHLSPEQFEREWQNPTTPKIRAQLLALMNDPQNIGCGHLAGILKDPARYGADAGLLAMLRRARMELAWDSAVDVQTQRLPGNHGEQAFVQLRPRAGFKPEAVPTIPTQSQYGQFFFEHVAAEEMYGDQFVEQREMLTGLSPDAHKLRHEIRGTHERLLAASAATLVKPGTPSIVIEYGDPTEREPFAIAG